MGRAVDRALGLSRATLLRDFAGILGRFERRSGEARTPVTHDHPLASGGNRV